MFARLLLRLVITFSLLFSTLFLPVTPPPTPSVSSSATFPRARALNTELLDAPQQAEPLLPLAISVVAPTMAVALNTPLILTVHLTNTHPVPLSHRYLHADAHTNCHRYPAASRHTYGNRNTHPHANSYTDPDTIHHPHTYAHTLFRDGLPRSHPRPSQSR